MAVLIPRVRVLALVGALTAVTCGDPLVDKSYHGVPLFTVQGQAFGTATTVSLDNPTVRLALFWMPATSEQDVTKYVEQPSTSMNVQVPRAFLLNIFDAPPSTLLVSDWPVPFGAATMLAYIDANGNGLRDEDEPVVGADLGRTILYVPETLSADASPTSAELSAGFHLASLPISCGRVPTPPDANGDCGVPLGARCHKDKDCGTGVCLGTFLQPWPDGYCAAKDPPPNACFPKGGVMLRGPPETNEGYWIKGCKEDADCGRDFPYVCDQKNLACMPTAMLSVKIADAIDKNGLCAPAKPDGGMDMGDGGMRVCHLDGGDMPPFPDGGCPGGMGVCHLLEGDMPTFPDGGCPTGPEMGECPGPDGGMMMRFPDGGCPGGMGMGQCPAGPDGGIPPRFPDGGCPGPPA